MSRWKSSIVNVVEEASTSVKVLLVTIFDARFMRWVGTWFRLFLSHMSPQGLVLTNQPIDSRNVLMKNNMPCKTSSIGLIKIRLYDSIIKTLGMFDVC